MGTQMSERNVEKSRKWDANAKNKPKTIEYDLIVAKLCFYTVLFVENKTRY